MSLTNRVGCFFLLVGGVLLVLFLASDVAQQQNCTLLAIGVLGVVVGFAMWRRNRPDPTPSGRFGTLSKLRQAGKRKGPPQR